MLRVQFNDKKSMQEVNFKTISEDVVELTGKKVLKNRSGFKIFRLNGEFLGNYSDYTKIVAEVPKGFKFGRA